MTDWKNIDLDRDIEREKCILDPYTFNQLLLEIHCNIEDKNITPHNIHLHFERELQLKIKSAREVFSNNLTNIVKKARKDRK